MADPDQMSQRLEALLGQSRPPHDPSPQPSPNPFTAAVDVYLTCAKALMRLSRYARITVDALIDYKDRPIDHQVHPDQLTELMMHLLKTGSRKIDAAFLKEEKEHADALVYGQASISMWSALEVFANDILIAILAADPKRLERIPIRIKMSIAEFYGLENDQRIEHVVGLVKQEVRASFGPGVGAFEPTFEAFGLKGPVEDLTKRQLLEFSAVRNCLAHRKGIVDTKFLGACGTTTLKLGEPILLTSNHAERYHVAAHQYAATVLERVKMLYEPELDFSVQPEWHLEQLKLIIKRAEAAEPPPQAK